MSFASVFFSEVVGVVRELLALYLWGAGSFLPHLAALFFVHVAVEYGLPLVLGPGVYDALGHKRGEAVLLAARGRAAGAGGAAQSKEEPSAGPSPSASPVSAAAASPAAAAALTTSPTPLLLHRRRPLSEVYGDPRDLAVERSRLAREARSMAVPTAFALVVASASAYALLVDPGRAYSSLRAAHYASTPLTDFLVRLAVAYFTWDLAVCVTEWWGAAYLLHAVACLAVFTAALRPFLHYMALVTLLFEASTPFLHARAALISSGQATAAASGSGGGALFPLANFGFALSFFVARIAVGWTLCYAWNNDMNALVASGLAHSPAVVRMYQACCALLSALNGYWMLMIVRGALGLDARGSKDGAAGGGEKRKKAA